MEKTLSKDPITIPILYEMGFYRLGDFWYHINQPLKSQYVLVNIERHSDLPKKTIDKRADGESLTVQLFIAEGSALTVESEPIQYIKELKALYKEKFQLKLKRF